MGSVFAEPGSAFLFALELLETEECVAIAHSGRDGEVNHFFLQLGGMWESGNAAKMEVMQMW